MWLTSQAMWSKLFKKRSLSWLLFIHFSLDSKANLMGSIIFVVGKSPMNLMEPIFV